MRVYIGNLARKAVKLFAKGSRSNRSVAVLCKYMYECTQSSLTALKTSTYLRLASDFIQTVKERVVVNRFNRIVQDVTDSLQSKTENVSDSKVLANHPLRDKSQKMSSI